METPDQIKIKSAVMSREQIKEYIKEKETINRRLEKKIVAIEAERDNNSSIISALQTQLILRYGLETLTP